ncbi:MAG: endonuclease/exonuclease/phosphatase family protein [Anaerolineae bacterium]|nr:endonuclease/exonuclease/phosphatase family protein [Anaerolineae bacterium]
MKFIRLLFVIALALLLIACNPASLPTDAIEPTKPSSLPQSTRTSIPSPTEESTSIPRGDLLISEIQGASHISPYKGQDVKNVVGIVTTISGEGFYMQSPHPDDDDRTSEGIFVYNPGLQKVKPGDAVIVQGQVIEHYPAGGQGELSITEIVYVEYEIISNGNALPEPILIGIDGRMPPTEIIDDDQLSLFDPEHDGLDFYESMEAMLVKIANPVSVAPINKYKELAVVPENGQFATGLSERGVLVISENDYNPERLLIDDALRSLPDSVPVGATFEGSSVIGVVDYTFGMYKIQPISKPGFITNPIEINSAPDSEPDELSIASYNVENLNAADPIERFAMFADHVVNHLRSPDIIVLSEIQDNDGIMNSNETQADLTGKKMIDAIIEAGGPVYQYTDVAPKDDRDGGEYGGNIRGGFLYREDKGLLLYQVGQADFETSAELMVTANDINLNYSPVRIDPTNFAFRSSRKPLIAQFTYQGQTLFVIGMHMNSKGGDTPLFGQKQPPRLESEVQRIDQAEVIASFIQQILTTSPDANVILAGDLNDFQFSPPLRILENAGLVNPIFSLPPNERYTYIYEGNAQALDHILLSAGIHARLTYFNIIHLNSEQPFRERLSDHDAVLARFSWNEPN